MQAEELIKIPVFLTSNFNIAILMFSLCNQQTKLTFGSFKRTLTHSSSQKSGSVCFIWKWEQLYFQWKPEFVFFFENGSLFCFLFVCLRIAVLKMGVHGLKMCFAAKNMLLMHFNHAPGWKRQIMITSLSSPIGLRVI